MAVRVGIPRALAYFAYGDLWKSFFENLGCEVIISPATNKGMIDNGTKETVGEACIPIKIYHGHVMWLCDKTDVIFIPRLLNIDTECSVTFCPKFLGLPDLVKASVSNIPSILSPDVSLHGRKSRLFFIAVQVARELGVSEFKGIYAMMKAFAKKGQVNMVKKAGLNFAIIGYPYFLHDDFLNFKIDKKLNALGVNILYSDQLTTSQLNRNKKKIPKSLFWEFSNKALLATYYFLDQYKVDGIIHLTAFACGPDAMVGKLMELECRDRNVPFLELTIDEHTGEAGIQTRVEAFVDMFRLRRKGA